LNQLRDKSKANGESRVLNKGIQTKNTEYVTSALESYRSSLELAKRNENEKIKSMILCNIGEAYYVLNEPKLALNHFNEALKRANEAQYKELISLLHNNIGNTFLTLNTYDKAIDYFKKAIELALKIGSEKILWEAYCGLGQGYEKCNDYAKAIECYEKSIEVIDMIRSQIYLDTFKTGYARNKLKVYEKLINLLRKMKADGILASSEDKIFSFVEKAKARAFLECLAESKVDVRERLSGKDRGELNEASSRITSLVLDLAKTEGSGQGRQELKEKLVREEDNYMRLISRIRADNPATANLVSPETYRLEMIQRKLLNGTSALIEYFLGDQQSLMLFITHNSAEIFPLPPRQAIEDSLKAYIKFLSSPPGAEFDGKIAGRRIFKDLLFPLEDKKNRNIEKLIIIPDGILYYLPFETLVLEDRGHPSAYLIDRYQVSYSPSASVLMFLHKKKSSQGVFKGLLAFGDPAYPQETSPEGNFKTGNSLLAEIYLDQGFVFSPIPYSRDEIRYISKHFPKDQMDIYLGKDAREKALKENASKDYQIT
jgi:tetratricopeptide (TPR) repeat protein